jgi:hypothetical protein
MGNRTVLARIRRLGEQAVDRFSTPCLQLGSRWWTGITGQNLPQKPIGNGSESGFAWAQGRRGRCDESHS